MTSRFLWGFRPFLACLATGLLAAPAVSAEPTDRGAEPTADVYVYRAAEGPSYFALALKGPALTPAATPRDHVVLVDTSASQTGEHRTQSLAVVRNYLEAVPATDRIALLAVDVAAERLSAGYVSPRGDEARAALELLEQRAPLGATNMLSGLRAALSAAANDRPTSIVYIGDGMSVANLIGQAELNQLLAELRGRKVAVNSYAVGPKTDLQLLGILAQQTGGVVRFDQADASLDEPRLVALELANAAAAPVTELEEIKIASAPGIELAQTALPLRSDRATVYFGRGVLPNNLKVAAATTDGRTLSWRLGADNVRPGGPYLASLWRQSMSDHGQSAASAGIGMLYAAQREFNDRVSELAAAGEAAVAVRNLAAAESAGRTLQQSDPTNARAKVILEAVGRLRNDQLAEAEAAPKAGEDALEERKGPPSDDAISQYEKLKTVKGQQLTLEVSRTIEAARKAATEDSESALSELKRAEGAVRSATDIEPDVRNQLIRRLQIVMQEVKSQKERDDIRKVKQAEVRAAIEAQNRVIDQFQRDEERMEQLIDQVRALIYEGWQGNFDAFDEAETVARVASNLRPASAITEQALWWSVASKRLDEVWRLRKARAKGYLETLAQVEQSAIPMPDEPPILWPNAQVWRALSERRKKWASVDLKKSSPAEDQIQSALDELTTVAFTDTPLNEAMQFLGSYHNFTVLIERDALEEAAIAEDQPITHNFSGITLRSALAIILKPLQLQYVIENEVMKITTVERAAEKLQTRVYPVADLVIQIQSAQGGLGGGAIGGGGGLGGGGGFGGGGGQFGGGGGGGFFSVPTGAAPRPARAAAPPQREIQDPEVRGLLKGILKNSDAKKDDARTSGTANSNGQGFAQVRDQIDRATDGKKKPHAVR